MVVMAVVMVAGVIIKIFFNALVGVFEVSIGDVVLLIVVVALSCPPPPPLPSSHQHSTMTTIFTTEHTLNYITPTTITTATYTNAVTTTATTNTPKQPPIPDHHQYNPTTTTRTTIFPTKNKPIYCNPKTIRIAILTTGINTTM